MQERIGQVDASFCSARDTVSIPLGKEDQVEGRKRGRRRWGGKGRRRNREEDEGGEGEEEEEGGRKRIEEEKGRKEEGREKGRREEEDGRGQEGEERGEEEARRGEVAGRMRRMEKRYTLPSRCLNLATEKLTRLTSGECVFICDHCNGSEAARPTDRDARPSEETGADNASQEDYLGPPGRLLHGLLLDALKRISFLTDQVGSLGEGNKRLRAETTRVSERQATLVCSLRDEVRACRAEIAGWRKAAGGAAAAPYNVPALRLRNGGDEPSAHLLTPPPERVLLPPGLSEVPPAGNLPQWGSPGSSSDGPPAFLGSVRDHRINLTASQDCARHGRAARLEPMLPRPKARTAALTGASETTKLCVASPSTGLRALFLRAHTKCICWPENETAFLQSGVSSFICKSCEKISGDARPNGDSQAGLDEASLSHHSSPPSPTASNRPEGPASSSPGGPNADMESLRALLLDSLKGISFLTDEVAAIRDENAQLRREYRQSSQLQASAIQSLRTELRAVRETRSQMGPAGGRQLPFSYAAVTSPHHPLSPARGGGGTPLLAGGASSSAPVDGLSATLNGSRTDLAEPVQPSGHPRRRDPSNFNGAGFRGAGHKFPTARRPLLRGGATASCIPVALPPPRPRHQRAVFVTRLGSSCDAAGLQAHIQGRGPVRELVCTRLKTRYEGYSSFHVTAAEDEMEKLFDPLFWPEGSLFKEFTGQLTDSRTYQAVSPTPFSNNAETDT
ncbi:hypothetical protein ISCGN_019257 [Ixodes scapularis]